MAASRTPRREHTSVAEQDIETLLARGWRVVTALQSGNAIMEGAEGAKYLE